jgi:uncharacterized protein YndB with AHSA1/START domain
MAFYQSTESLLIQAEPEKIYAALTDWRERSKWRPGLTLQWEGADQAQVGQRVRFKVAGLIPSRFEYKITGLEPPHRVYMEYQGAPLKGTAAIEVERENSGCRVSFYWTKVEPVGFLAKLYFALGLGLAGHRRQTLKTLDFLRFYMEKDPA